MLSLLITIIAIVVFINQKRIIQFYVVTLASLFPLTTGSVRSIPNLMVLEWAGPLFFMIMLNELIPLNSALRTKRIINFNGAKIFLLAFIVLLIWAAISFVNNEILVQTIKSGPTGMKRIYFSMINALLLFISVIFFFGKYYNDFSVEKWLKILIYFSIVAGFLGLIGYIMKISVPFLGGRFDYQPKATTMYGGVAYRMSGLELPAMIGLSSCFALFTIKRKFNSIYILIFTVLLFLSGGRIIWLGTFFSVAVFFIVLFPSKLGYVISLALLASIVGLIILPQKVIEGQIGRITAIDTENLDTQNISRYVVYKLYINNFLENPVFGKGLSEYKGFIYSTYTGVEEFARAQQFAGGHGAYLSILSTFGIGGIFYLLTMLFGGIIYSFKLFAKNRFQKTSSAAVAVFSLLLLLMESVVYLSGHSGLDDFLLYLLVGLVASFRIQDNNNLINTAEPLVSQ